MKTLNVYFKLELAKMGCDFWDYDQSETWTHCIAIDKNDKHYKTAIDLFWETVKKADAREVLQTTIKHEDGDFTVLSF